MIEKINIKVLAIIVAIVALVSAGIFITMKLINRQDKSYVLEKVAKNDYKYFGVYTDEKYGVINAEGKLIIQNIYENIIIPNPTKGVFICMKEDKVDVLNENAENIFTEYENIEAIQIEGTVTDLPYEKSVLKYESDGKIGLIDFSGNIITEAIYEEISSVKYKEGELIAKKNGKYGVINNKGVELIPFEYEQIEADKYYHDGTYSKSGYIVKRTTTEGYRYGYIDSDWNLVLDTEFTNVTRILDIDSEDIYLIVSKNGQYGVVKNKDIEIEFSYQRIEYNKDTKLFAVERSGKYGVIDITGKTIVDMQYKSIRFNGIYIYAESYTEDIYFNKNGERIENSYIAMTEVPELSLYVTVDNSSLYGIIDENGEEIIKNEYLYIEYVFDKYFVAYKEGQGLGVIDKENNVFIEFKYDVLSKIGEYNLLKGVDMENNVTDIFLGNMEKGISMENATLDIHTDYIEIYNESSASYVNSLGELKTANEILENNKLFAIYKDDKWGFSDVHGNIKVECTYDYVTEFNYFGFAGIKKDGKWGVIDDEGNIVCECKFDFGEEIVKPEFIGKYYKTFTDIGEIYYSDEI